MDAEPFFDSLSRKINGKLWKQDPFLMILTLYIWFILRIIWEHPEYQLGANSQTHFSAVLLYKM